MRVLKGENVSLILSRNYFTTLIFCVIISMTLSLEERKRIKYQRDLAALRTPEGKARRNKRQNIWRKKHPIKRMTWNANLKDPSGNQLTFMDVFRQAKKQKLICPLTGKKLNASNISLDHILPMGRGGLNIPSNIQLVDYETNLMKKDMLESEFFILMQSILDYQKRKGEISSPPSP